MQLVKSQLTFREDIYAPPSSAVSSLLNARCLFGLFSIVKFVAMFCSETSEHFHTIRRYIPEDRPTHNHRSEDLKTTQLITET